MKILLDFDGTLTNIQHERDFEFEFLTHYLQTQCGVVKEDFREAFDAALACIQDAPEMHGWCDNGRISAFCDEDLFMGVASAMTLLDSWVSARDVRVGKLAAKLEACGLTFMALTEMAHRAINAQALCAFNTPEPTAVATINTLLDRDCEIVVASNSPAERIIDKFEHVGLKPVDHDDNPSARFRIRGNARKFRLGDHPAPVSFGARSIDTDRPFFADVLRKERPQVIVGDVFSLDLALPIEMARREPMVYEDMQLYLRTRSYTPQWAIDCALNPPTDAPVTVRLLNHFSDLPSLIIKR